MDPPPEVSGHPTMDSTPAIASQRAAESGRWTARWTGETLGGTYLAVWRKVTGQWVIESELYVTLT